MLESQITNLIGSSPLGDPEQMRRRAAAIKAQAEALLTFAHYVETVIAALVFEGPAAARMRTHLDELRKEAAGTAEHIRSLATYLMQTAGSTESAQSEWGRRFHEVEQRLREAVDHG